MKSISGELNALQETEVLFRTASHASGHRAPLQENELSFTALSALQENEMRIGRQITLRENELRCMR